MKKGVKYEKSREMILAFPEVTEGRACGAPIFKVKNKMAARLSEEFDETIVIKVDLPLRSSLLEGAPDAFYITPHYAPHPLMLVKIARPRRRFALFNRAGVAARRPKTRFSGFR